MFHLISGVTDSTLQKLFAISPDNRLSASTVNAPWHMVSLLVAWFLLECVSGFDLMFVVDARVPGLDVVLVAPGLAWGFIRFRGNHAPTEVPSTP